jgi:GntR family transcriptional regulator/MocR family aminotransferase
MSTQPSAGQSTATLLRGGVDDVALVRLMNQRGLTATALSSCYAGSKRRSGLLLGFGGWDEDRIAEATRTLGKNPHTIG